MYVYTGRPIIFSAHYRPIIFMLFCLFVFNWRYLSKLLLMFRMVLKDYNHAVLGPLAENGFMRTKELCNILYPSETHLLSKSREISFAHNLFPSYPSFCRRLLPYHCRARCKISKRLENCNRCYGWRYFARFGFKITFSQISNIAQPPRCQANKNR